MTLFDRIAEDMKAAMKAHDELTLGTLRFLRAALKNTQIDLRRELTDDDVLAVLKTQVKQLRDSLVSFESGGRGDLAEGAKREITQLEAYLPAQLSDEALVSLVQRVISELGLVTQKDMGKVIGAVVTASQGAADGGRVSAAVKAALSQASA